VTTESHSCLIRRCLRSEGFTARLNRSSAARRQRLPVAATAALAALAALVAAALAAAAAVAPEGAWSRFMTLSDLAWTQNFPYRDVKPSGLGVHVDILEAWQTCLEGGSACAHAVSRAPASAFTWSRLRYTDLA